MKFSKTIFTLYFWLFFNFTEKIWNFRKKRDREISKVSQCVRMTKDFYVFSWNQLCHLCALLKDVYVYTNLFAIWRNFFKHIFVALRCSKWICNTHVISLNHSILTVVIFHLIGDDFWCKCKAAAHFNGYLNPFHP